MAWLAVHIWVELLIAAFFGGLIGWALHARRAAPATPTAAKAVAASADDGELRARIAELEAQLGQEREAVVALKAEMPAAKAAAEEEASLQWRNRYLESRVRFLEGKLADAENGPATEPAPPAPDDEADEATRLRWRNRYLEGRVKYLEEELSSGRSFATTPVAAAPLGLVSTPAAAPKDDAGRPELLTGPRDGKADDLKEITGIGPKLEKVLNGLGVYHFDQIAAWTQEQIDWVNSAISFRGRIEREKWVAQAAQLAQGVETDGARKYRAGEQT
jgi:predicted flap endonuclease-1-like 5' DNA nuclease